MENVVAKLPAIFASRGRSRSRQTFHANHHIAQDRTAPGCPAGVPDNSQRCTSPLVVVCVARCAILSGAHATWCRMVPRCRIRAPRMPVSIFYNVGEGSGNLYERALGEGRTKAIIRKATKGVTLRFAFYRFGSRSTLIFYFQAL